MITKIKFNKKIRSIFKRYDSFEIKPLTILAGDNGSGKSTFLNEIVNKLKHPESKIITIEKDGNKMDSWMFMDFEKDNPRIRNYDGGVFAVFSHFRSHGETNMDVICNHLSEFKNKLVLLDEPDQALSIRSIIRLKSVIDKMIENGCQIIMAVHSETLMRLAGEVLNIECKKWMNFQEFIEFQNEPKRMRTVDKFEENVYYVVKFVLENGSERFLSTKTYGSIVHGLSYAKRFKTKETVEKSAVIAMKKNKKEFKKTKGLEREFFDLFVSYEIVEEEELFPDE